MVMSKKIVLWGHDDLLSFFVDLFLTSQTGWDVVHVSFEKNLESLIQLVNRVNPEVVIIQLGEHSDNSNVPAILSQYHPNLKVITLSLNNNLMEVYSKQNVLVESIADFISIVEGSMVFQTSSNTNKD